MPKLKKVVYVLLAVFLGILLSFIIHGLIEMLYLKIAADRGIAVTWTFSCALPAFLQIGLVLAGIIGGFFLGLYWWKKIYGTSNKT